MNPCSIPECIKPAHGHGWCSMHLARWRRHGDPLVTKTIHGGELSRFLAKTEKTDTCWLWIGAINNAGYPQFSTPESTYAHRWSYAHFVGPIGSGLQIDHLCRLRICVNPQHLEAVTQAVNIRRSDAGHDGNGLCRNRLHDVTDPTNVHHFRSGRRTCKPCMKTSQARRDARRTERRAAA